MRDNVSKSSEIRCQKKHEPKSTRPGALKKKKAELLAHKSKGKTALRIGNEAPSNDLAKLSFSNSLSSLEDIKKAQLVQVQRRNLLNYLSMKQHHDYWCDRELHHQQLKAQVKKQIKSAPAIPRLEDINTMPSSNATEQQEQQLLRKVSNAYLPVLPAISSFSIRSENDEWKIKYPFEVKKIGTKLEISSTSTMLTASNQLQLKGDNNELSLLADIATRMPSSSKEFDYYDSTNCNLPPKKKFKKRLYDDEVDCSVRRYNDQIFSTIERASAA